MKIGLNAKIFIIEQLNNVTQIIGKATQNVTTKYLGSIENINIKTKAYEVDERRDFEGALITANYNSNGNLFYMDENGKMQGLVYDCFRVAANYLNLTVVYQEPNPINRDIRVCPI